MKVLMFNRARLHQASVSTLLQISDDASNTVLIENNGVTPDWGCNPFFEQLYCYQ